MGRVRQACAAVGVATLTVCASARAEVAATADVGVGYSDNIRRTETNEVNETIGAAGLNLDWRERTRRLRGDATIDLSYFEYLDDTFDSEVVGTGNGSLTLGIVPDTLHWVVEDTFGQARSDPFAPVTPDNREDLNYFSTGPDLIVRFGDTGFGRVFGRWSSTNYETSPLDAERTTGGISIGRRASSRTELTLNGVTERVTFDNPLSPDYDRKSVFAGYKLDAARTSLTADLGYTWLDRDGSDDTTGSALVNITAARELSAASLLRLTLSSQLGDAGESLRGALSGEVVGGGGQITASSDPFENRLASLQWQFARNRTGFGLGVSWNQERYETQTLFDRTRYSYTASFSRQLSRTLDLELIATLDNEQFENVDLDTDEARFGVTLSWRAWRALGLRLLVERSDRNTSNGLGEYQENRAFLRLAYYWGDPLARSL
jgi:hypothetical protein